MNCPMEERNPELLVAYAAGRLDSETGVLVERHLADCAECREAAAAQASLWKALDFWEAPPVSLDFDQRLYRRISEERRQPWWERAFRPLPLRTVVPVTATACLLIVAGWLLDHPGKFTQIGAHKEKVRVEQVERTLDDLDLLQSGMTADGAPPSRSDKM